jgi:hypothetical protein
MAFKRIPPPGNVRRAISLGNNFRGVTTNKRGHLVQFESEQERKLVLLLERDPLVANYGSQPEVLHFRDTQGRARTYTPDFKVWRTDGQIELHEVTLESRRVTQESVQQQETAAQAICQQRGWRYIVHTDQTLPSGYEYVNLDWLAGFRAHTYASSEITAWWLDQLAGQGQVQPGVMLAQSRLERTVGPLLNGLYHLLWHGVIRMDWHQPFIWRGDFHPAGRIWYVTPSPTGHQPDVQIDDPGQTQEVHS